MLVGLQLLISRHAMPHWSLSPSSLYIFRLIPFSILVLCFQRLSKILYGICVCALIVLLLLVCWVEKSLGDLLNCLLWFPYLVFPERTFSDWVCVISTVKHFGVISPCVFRNTISWLWIVLARIVSWFSEFEPSWVRVYLSNLRFVQLELEKSLYWSFIICSVRSYHVRIDVSERVRLQIVRGLVLVVAWIPFSWFGRKSLGI